MTTVIFLHSIWQSCISTSGIDPKPLIVNTDCASQLQNDVLLAFRDDSHVSSRSMYANVSMLILLRYDSMIDEGSDLLTAALWIIGNINMYSPCLLHECKSHVYLAIKNWVVSCDRSKESPEIRRHIHQFYDIFKSLAMRITVIPSISQAISLLCATITILKRKIIPCPSFNMMSKAQEHHDASDTHKKCWKYV